MTTKFLSKMPNDIKFVYWTYYDRFDDFFLIISFYNQNYVIVPSNILYDFPLNVLKYKISQTHHQYSSL